LSASVIGVLMNPGAMQLAVTLRFAYSAPSVLIRPMMPAFDALYTTSLTNFPVAFPYAQWTTTVKAVSTSTNVTFGFRQDPDYWRLDDVSVVDSTIPEPSSVYLLLLGGSMAAFALRRRRQA
jgi:hypothetical protein